MTDLDWLELAADITPVGKARQAFPWSGAVDVTGQDGPAAAQSWGIPKLISHLGTSQTCY